MKAADAPGVDCGQQQARQHDDEHHEEHHAHQPGTGRGRALEIGEVVGAQRRDRCKVRHFRQSADARDQPVGAVKEGLHRLGVVGKPRAFPSRPVGGAEAPHKQTCDQPQGKGDGRKVQNARHMKPYERRGKRAPAGVEARLEALFEAQRRESRLFDEGGEK